MAKRGRVDRAVRFTAGVGYSSTTPAGVPRRVRRSSEAALYDLPSAVTQPFHTVYPWYESRVLQRGVTRGFVAHPLRSALPSYLSFDREAAPRALRRRAMQLSVDVPSRVLMCVRRKQRRQVLFAYGRAGFSGSARKRHWKRNDDSSWRC